MSRKDTVAVYYNTDGDGTGDEVASITGICVLNCNDIAKAQPVSYTHLVQKGIEALKNGACIVTDTQMARSGINKTKLAQFGGEVFLSLIHISFSAS